MEPSEAAATTPEHPGPRAVPIARPRWPVPPRTRRATLEQELAPYEVTRIPCPKPHTFSLSLVDLTHVDNPGDGADVVVDLTDEV